MNTAPNYPVHVCFRDITETEVIRRQCPTCEKCRRFLCELEEWYGWTTTCLTCGERWEEGERSSRPFERAWREKRVAAAKSRLARFRKEAKRS